jgi:hypothetical protein
MAYFLLLFGFPAAVLFEFAAVAFAFEATLLNGPWHSSRDSAPGTGQSLGKQSDKSVHRFGAICPLSSVILRDDTQGALAVNTICQPGENPILLPFIQ